MSERAFTPVEIEVLLHCYYSSEPAFKGIASPAIRQAVMRLTSLGLIEATSQQGECITTRMGNKLVDMICKTPLPIEHTSWEDPREVNRG